MVVNRRSSALERTEEADDKSELDEDKDHIHSKQVAFEAIHFKKLE